MTHGQRSSGWVSRLGSAPLVWLALAASGPLAGCSKDQGGHVDVDQAGSISLSLTTPSDVTINAVTYSIAGTTFTKSGTIDVSASPTISATLGGIPAGKFYTLTLTAKALDNTTFTGSATFDIVAGAATAVTVHLDSTSKTGTGSVVVNGTINVGPRVDELTVSPLSAFVGGSIKLLASGSDPDGGPAGITYYWSTTGGSIDNPIAPSATLTSATPGTFTVTVTVSDGEATATGTATVTFIRPPAAAGGAGGAGAAGGAAGGAGGSVATGPGRPNILLIIADDLGAEASALYPDLAGTKGQAAVPNITTLADNGVVFNNAWASPVCSPTRATIVSGQYGFRTGVTTVGLVLPTSTVTLFDRLNAETPYTHALFGKYHLGGGSIDVRPPAVETDAASILQHVRDIGITNYRGIVGGGLTDYFNWWTFDENGPTVANTTYSTTALTDYAIDFIHQQKASSPDKPWFLYQSFNAPHAANGGNNPFQVPPAELHHIDLSAVGNPAPGVYQTNIPVYQADIQALDTELGRLLAEVDFSNTLVIFVGDNGVPPPVKDTATGLRDAKGTAYEGGVRVPLIVAGAGVTRRGRDNTLFVTADLYATILDVAGVAGVGHVNDSYSLKPLFTDEAASSGRTVSFAEISNGTSGRQYGLRDTRFKLVNNLGKWELFDLVTDPHEATNLFDDPHYAAARGALLAQLAVLKAGAPAGYFNLP